MAGEHRDWTRHGPGRFLLWWPFLSFASMAALPNAGIAPIVASGAGLALVGVVAALAARIVGRWILLHRAGTAPAALGPGRAVGEGAAAAATVVPGTVVSEAPLAEPALGIADPPARAA